LIDYKKILIKSKKLIFSEYAGRHNFGIKGDGLDFKELREYTLDSDVRFIDWKISAKFQKPFIKEYQSDTSFTIYFVLALDKTIEFEDKKEMMFEAFSLLAYSSLKDEDRISILLFDNEKRAFYPPSNQEELLLHFGKLFEAFQTEVKRVDFNELFKHLHFKTPAIVVIFADFLAKVDLSKLNPENEYIFIGINKDVEFDLSEYQSHTILNLDRQVVVEELSKRMIDSYNKKVAQLHEELKEQCKKMQIRYINLTDKSSIFQKLLLGLSDV
jgi:uncharacterized protein (DUF58 family)